MTALSVAAVTLLAFFSLPLPWHPDNAFTMPFLLIAGIWIAIVSTTAFAAFYAYQVSVEANQLADAAGITLGDVMQMSESSQGYHPMEMKASQMRSLDVPIETGEVSVRAQVNMQFAIAQD